MSLHWCNTRFGGNSSGWPALDSPLTMARWSVSRLWPHIAWQGAHVSMYSREDVRALITARLMDAFTPQHMSQSIQLKRYRLFLGGLQHPGEELLSACFLPERDGDAGESTKEPRVKQKRHKQNPYTAVGVTICSWDFHSALLSLLSQCGFGKLHFTVLIPCVSLLTL